MEQDPVLNAHSKEEYPPMHTNRINTSLIIIATAVYSIFIFAGCHNSGKTSEPINDSALVDSSLPDMTDSIYDETISDEVPELPDPSFSRFGSDIHKVSRTLSDSEIASLLFDGYQFEKYNDDFYKKTLDSWKEYANKYKPYYSIVYCPSCHKNLLVVYGSSPNEYWQSLCGREGWFAICTHCHKVLDFEIVAMN